MGRKTKHKPIRSLLATGDRKKMSGFLPGLAVLKSALFLVRWWLFYALDAVAGVSTKRGVNNGVAIVRLDYIGDFVLWLDSVGALLEVFAGRPITLVGNVRWSELAEKLPF